MNYKTSGSLLARGARWGDIECLDVEDILLDLQKRSVEIAISKANSNMFRAARAAKVKVVRKHKPVQKPCIGCKKFTIHSNPPSHFTEEDKKYCCAYCNVTGGKKHGGSCERNR